MESISLIVEGNEVIVSFNGNRISNITELIGKESVSRSYLNDFLFGFLYIEDLFEEVLPTLDEVLCDRLTDEVISNDQLHALVTKDQTYFFHKVNYDANELKSNSTMQNSVDTQFFAFLLRQLHASLME